MQAIFQVTLLVDDYDEGLDFYVTKLGFTLLENTPLNETTRWVVVSAGEGTEGCALVLAKPTSIDESAVVGKQTAQRVGFFLRTDDIERDYEVYQSHGVRFLQEPITHDYGTVAIFEDPFGTKWDLVQKPI